MIPFIDLKTQQERIKDKIDKRIQDVLAHGQYIMGPEVKELETRLSEFTGAKHSIAVSSGTDALVLALMALDLAPGDEVIVPDFSFFATAEVVELLRGTPVFCEVDAKTYNLDPNRLEEVITSKTKAIMPVSLYGQCAEFEEINKIASKHGIKVIEDGAQSFGGSYKGKKSMNLSDMGCTSFFPAKPLGCYGDGGAVFTNDDGLALKIRELLNHGQEKRYYHTRIGINGRMDTIQAAILIEKLAIFDDELKKRQEVASRYNKHLSDVVEVPYVEDYNQSAWAQYTVRHEERTRVIESLKEKKIPTSIHYPLVLSEQPVLSKYKSNCPISKKCASEVFSLPMHPYLEEGMQQEIIEGLKSSV